MRALVNVIVGQGREGGMRGRGRINKRARYFLAIVCPSLEARDRASAILNQHKLAPRVNSAYYREPMGGKFGARWTRFIERATAKLPGIT